MPAGRLAAAGNNVFQHNYYGANNSHLKLIRIMSTLRRTSGIVPETDISGIPETAISGMYRKC